MLEVVNCPDNARHGGAYVATAMNKGTFVVISGTFSAAEIASLPANQKSIPGFAYEDDRKLVRAYAGLTGRAYPVDKKIFVPEDADLATSNEQIVAGAGAIYYEEGEFRTNEFTDVTTTSIFGNYLKLSASGTLTDESTAFTETGESVARVIDLQRADADAIDHRLHYRLIR